MMLKKTLRISTGNKDIQNDPVSITNRHRRTSDLRTADAPTDSQDIEKRFREDIATGKINGDIIVLDKEGNVVRDDTNYNIFDL